jgi:hypothetical protein
MRGIIRDSLISRDCLMGTPNLNPLPIAQLGVPIAQSGSRLGNRSYCHGGVATPLSIFPPTWRIEKCARTRIQFIYHSLCTKWCGTPDRIIMRSSGTRMGVNHLFMPKAIRTSKPFQLPYPSISVMENCELRP